MSPALEGGFLTTGQPGKSPQSKLRGLFISSKHLCESLKWEESQILGHSELWRYMCVCVYIYIYIHTHTHTQSFIDICTFITSTFFPCQVT